MRKITQEACTAFRRGERYSVSNTRVTSTGDDTKMELHGNVIAYTHNGALYVSLCGWNTNTTRERLNGLDGVRVSTKNGQVYLNGHKWNGDTVQVSTFAGNVSDTDTEKRNAMKKHIAAYSKLYTFPYPMPSSGDCWYCALTTDSKKSLGDATKNHEHLEMHMGLHDDCEVYVHGSMIVNALREHGCNDMQISVWLHMDNMQDSVQKAIRKYLQKRLIP